MRITQSKKSAGLTKVATKNLKDLFDSYQEREAQIMSYAQKAQMEAEYIIAEAKLNGKLLLDEAASKGAKMNEDKRDWEKEKESIARTYHFKDSEIDLNIGGQHFTTTLTTLTRFPDTMIGAMFSGRHDLKKNHAGVFFIDRDGMHFRQILNFLRSPETYQLNMEANLKEELKGEANFYGLGDLMFPPFKPAQPKNVETEQGYGVTISQDIQGMWFMVLKYCQIDLRRPIIYCRNCQIGFIKDQIFGGHNNCQSIKAFNTGREIFPNQPKCCVISPCPNGCSL
jgi:hypothetical protein